MKTRQKNDRGIWKWIPPTANGPGLSRGMVGLLFLLGAVMLGVAACNAPRPAPADDGTAQSAAHGQAPAAAGRTLVTDFRDFEIAAYQGATILGGDQTTFSRVFEHGKPVVLNFWAGQCPPCRAEMPAFQKAADEFQDKVIFVGVDVGVYTGLGSPDDARQLLSALDVRYPAAQAVDASPLRLYQVRGMPTTVFLSPSGRVVDDAPGMLVETDLRNRLDKLIAASS